MLQDGSAMSYRSKEVTAQQGKRDPFYLIGTSGKSSLYYMHNYLYFLTLITKYVIDVYVLKHLLLIY